MRLLRGGWLCLAVSVISSLSAADEAAAQQAAVAPERKTPASANADPKTVSELTEQVRDSIVVVSFQGRDGEEQGVGTGFVVSPDGLIATNLHVIGEARPITVRTADGREYEVTAVHATEQTTDLALIRVDAQNLPALELGDSENVRQGQQVVAIGNPMGLEHSVVAGVVSGRREIDGIPMIQLAIPIERGNSGGPLLDRQGRVLGLLTLKSQVTENLGFAMPVDALKPLLQRPNPVPMDRWLTIGALDPDDWETRFGAGWRQRAGRIRVEGWGEGFGGRSLCLWQGEPPERPFEIAVTVRLEDESGAAGLVFHSDGGDKHYGFYPSHGRLRLSRFDGPDVFRWRVLEQRETPHYKRGEWNRLKVRLERGHMRCFVNGELVIESRDAVYREGRVGLCTFRATPAEFKNFRVAKEVPSVQPTPEVVERVAQLAESIAPDRPPRPELIEDLLDEARTHRTALKQQADLLEQKADRLRQLADAVHEEQVRRQLAALFESDTPDLLRAALLVARLDNPDLNVEAYVEDVEDKAEELRQQLPDDADAQARLDALNEYLFKQEGYHGSRTNYYHRSNSYLNEVIDDREGIPITLSVLYMELGRRIGLDLEGVGLPGHFVVRVRPDNGEPKLIDVFDRGKILTREAAAEKVESTAGRPFDERHLQRESPEETVLRILRNLLNVAREDRDAEAMLRYVETMVALQPESGENRWLRAVLRFQTDRTGPATADVEWLLQHRPQGVDLRRVREFRRVLENATRNHRP